MSASQLVLILLISVSLHFVEVENKSIFGIGTRIYGDQLLLKDVLISRPAGTDENPTINFNYAIPEPITYVEMMAEENIYANVSFSNADDLVNGTVTAIQHVNNVAANNIATATTLRVPKSFEILITIYGLNETMLNVNPAYILNRDQVFDGILKPFIEMEAVIPRAEKLGAYHQQHDSANDNRHVIGDDDNDDDDDDDDNDGDDGDDDDDDEANIDIDGPNNTNDDNADIVEVGGGVEVEIIDDSDEDFQHKDKIIEIGHRQQGDYLIYETYQTSMHSTTVPANHTVIFYYIDSDFITYVKFIIFDHFADKSLNDADYVAPLAEYSHFSPNTLKATLTDHNTTSLFVQMFIYGYRASELPMSYVPFLPPPHWRRLQDVISERTTPLQRLKNLLNSRKHDEEDDNDFDQRGSDMETEMVKLTGDVTEERLPQFDLGIDDDDEDFNQETNDLEIEEVHLTSRTNESKSTDGAIMARGDTWLATAITFMLLYYT